MEKYKIMYNSTYGNITVASIIDDRRAKKDEKFPVKIRVTYNRERKYYSTGKTLSMKEWEDLPKTKSTKFIQVRSEIQTTFNLIDDTVLELYNENNFSFDTLNLRLSRGTNDTVNAGFKVKIQNLEDEGRSGTQLYNIAVLNSIVGFAGENVTFSSITVDWLKRYEKHMLKENKTYTTVGMYMRALRAIINEAKKNGVIKENQYPFGKDKYEIPTGEGRKLALTLQQIKNVVSYTDGNPTTERYRDLWFFSYLCNGVNFADLLKLKYSNVDGKEISFYRSKTIRTSKVKREIRAIITPEMEHIIDKWGNPDKKPNNYIFPYLTGNGTPMQEKKIILDVTKRTNKRLKIIGTAVGIEGLTTYTARHSYATVLKRSGANIAFISESLGHNDLKTTENYLDSFEIEERMKNATLLTQGFYD